MSLPKSGIIRKSKIGEELLMVFKIFRCIFDLKKNRCKKILEGKWKKCSFMCRNAPTGCPMGTGKSLGNALNFIGDLVGNAFRVVNPFWEMPK
jgi:hypothetical protein